MFRTIAYSKQISFVIFTISLSLSFCVLPNFSQDLSRAEIVGEISEKDIAKIYKGSYALIIGASKYQNKAWRELPGVREDVAAVETALKGQDFEITKVLDPTADQLTLAFRSFINKYGQEQDNRLLIYFAGHGHTIKTNYGSEMGYIVPVDAPNPPGENDRTDFTSFAMPMEQIEIFAKQINAKHALFVFDACFAGSIFVTGVSRATAESIDWGRVGKPVRYFLTSGGAGETVPDKSKFREQFIAAISGEADLNDDGFVTGIEIGRFISQTFSSPRNSTTPQNGAIDSKYLNQGDFIFFVPNFNRAAKKSIAPVEATYKMPDSLTQAIGLYNGTSGQINEPRAKQLFIETSGRGDILATMWIARHYLLGRCGFRKDEGGAQQLAKTVIEQVRQLAEKGNDEAMFLLGDAYYSGLGVTQDYPQAIYWLRIANEKGNAAATNNLGVAYGEGKGLPKDNSQEMALYQLAAEKGYFMAISNLGWIYRNGVGVPINCTKSLDFFTKIAEKGSTRGMYNVGDIYFNGCQEIKKDVAQAIKWHTKAIENGYSDSMYALAWIYRSSPLPDDPQTANKVAGVNLKTIRYDFPKVIEWYEKAIEAGDDDSLVELGGLYRDGAEGFAKDERQSFLFFKKYADAGRIPALEQLGWCYEFGKGVPIDKLRASKYYKQAADKGAKFSMAQLGQFYLDGKFIPQDLVTAEKYLRQTYDVFPEASIALGLMYEKGIGVKQSYQQATAFFSKFAYPWGVDLNLRQDIQVGNVKSQIALGRIYESGSEDIKDIGQAIQWYRRAAFQGNKDAMERLAIIYETGNGTEKDLKLAEMWRKNAKGSIKKFTVPCDFKGQKIPFYVFVMEEYPPDEDNPMREDIERIAELGAKMPTEVSDSFKKLLKIARDNKVSFSDLCVYALGAASENKKDETKK